MSSSLLDELEKELAELSKIKIYNEEVKNGAASILDRLPSPEDKGVDDKVRILLMRCKVRLLQPKVSKEAEEDINTILKLNKGSAETWVELSECLFRRNACKEALDALENALRLDPNYIPALCQYSQIQRNRCGTENFTAAEKQSLLEDAVSKAKAAIQIDPESGEAWNALSLSLLSKSTLLGATREELRKSYAAMQQAEAKEPEDPDVHYNKGMLESLTGHFGAAASEFGKAYSLDQYRLKGTKAAYEENLDVLRRINSSMQNSKGIGKREFKKMCKNLDSFIKKNGDVQGEVINFCVINIVSEPLMQPVSLLVIDPSHKFSLLLFYQVKSGAFKIGDVVSAPSRTLQREDVVHRVDAVPAFGSSDTTEVALPHIFGESNAVMVNGRRIPESFRASLQVSSRLFA